MTFWQTAGLFYIALGLAANIGAVFFFLAGFCFFVSMTGQVLNDWQKARA